MAPVVQLLDYKAGNVRSVVNALRKLGYTVQEIASPDEIRNATLLVFPGVGAFGSCVARLKEQGFWEPLKEYIASGRPLLGVCLGMQLLFASSEESPGVEGLGVIAGPVQKFDSAKMAVPHIGWNGVALQREAPGFASDADASALYYFVHSYRVSPEAAGDWALTLTDYGGDRFVSAVAKGRVLATQFHPEKSGVAGLRLLDKYALSCRFRKSAHVRAAHSTVRPAAFCARSQTAPRRRCTCRRRRTRRAPRRCLGA